MQVAAGEADRWAAARRLLLEDDPADLGIAVARDAQRHALLTLILASAPDPATYGRALERLFGFTPIPLDIALLTLAHNQLGEQPVLRPMLTRNLVRLAIDHPDVVAPSGDDDEDVPSLRVPIQVAIDVLHLALAIEAGRQPDDDEPVEHITRAFQHLVEPADDDRPLRWDRRDELATWLDDDDPPPGGGSDDDDVSGALPPPPPLPHTDDEGAISTRSGELPKSIHDSAIDSDSYAAKYYVAVAEALGLDVDQVTPPACSDAEGEPGQPCQVKAQWFSTAAVSELGPWTDPMNWVGCNKGIFFKDMQPQKGDAGPTGTDWKQTLVETVEIFGKTLVTDLTFDHWTIATGNEPTWMGSDYQLPDPPLKPKYELSWDYGKLEVRRRSFQGEFRTQATCTKYFRFDDPYLDGYAELACDTWWGELSIVMSTNCGHGY